MFIHPGLPNMKRNMSRKTKHTQVNKKMQNFQNEYCESVVYVTKHSVRAMTTAVKLASFTEKYFPG